MATNTAQVGGVDTNWWTAGNWDLGHAPTTGEDVEMAGIVLDWDHGNGATIPASGVLNSITSAGTAGQIAIDMSVGSYTLNATTITAGTKPATSGLLYSHTASANTLTVNGNITGGSNAAAYGLYISNSGTFVVNGNITGSGSANGAYSTSSGVVNVTGNLTGGSGDSKHGMWTSGYGAVTITGNIIGGSGAVAHGLYAHRSGAVTLTGKMINSTQSVAFFGKPPTWNGGDARVTVWGGVNYGPEPTATEMLSGVVCGDTTGTLAATPVLGGPIS